MQARADGLQPFGGLHDFRDEVCGRWLARLGMLGDLDVGAALPLGGTATKQFRVVTFGFLGGRSLTAAVTRRPPKSRDTMVASTGSYAYDVGVWALSIVQGPFSVARAKPYSLRFATFPSLFAL